MNSISLKALRSWKLHAVPPSFRDSLFFAYRNIQRAILDTDGYKLIVYFTPEGKEKRRQLFNLAADPLELNDLIGLSALAKKKAELRIKMHTRMIQLDDPLATALQL